MQRVKAESLTSSVLESLAKYVEDSSLEVGDKFPPEREVAQRLGVSRPLLREALQHWTTLGFVQKVNGRGTFLRSKISANNLVLVVNLENQSLLHALEIRRALEPEAAGLAALRATKEQISLLHHLLSDIEEAYRKYGDAPEQDWAFHQAIYTASGNPLFHQLIGGIRDVFHRFWENPFQKPDFARRGITHHHKLVACIEQGDTDGARASSLAILQVLEEDLGLDQAYPQ